MNGNETNTMKLTCSTQNQCERAQGEPYSPAHVGARIGHNACKEMQTPMSGFAFGTQGFLDTIMLVLVTRNARVGGYAQCGTQTGSCSCGI